MKSFDLELVSGSVMRSLWKLAWPAVALHLVNGLHGFVDHVLVGYFLGYESNAAIGVAWQLFLVMMVFVASLFHGTSVLVARYAGRQDREAIARIVYHTFLAMVYIFLFVAIPMGYFAAPHLLPVVNAAPEVQAQALPYLRVLFSFSGFLFIMIMLTNALQAAGDPRTPLKLGILATTLNIVITTVFITGPGPVPQLGILAPALGTTLAPLVSILILFVLMARGAVIIPWPREFPLVPDFALLRVVARIGIPAGLQGVLLNVGGVLLLRFVGSLENSAAAQAAYTICYSQLFSFVTWGSFGLRAAAAALMGQNIGAEKLERGRSGVYRAGLLAAAWAAMLGVLFWTIPEALLGLFSIRDATVLELGSSLLRYLTFSGIFLATTMAFTGGLQGAGDTKSPMLIAFASQIFVLLGFCAIMDALGRLTAEALWFAILLSHSSRFVLTYWAFQRGKWANIRIEIDR